MSDLNEKHMELLDAVNDAKTEAEHGLACERLNGFRDALECMARFGSFMIDADYHSMSRFGDDAPMCCGVLLNWEPTAPVSA